MKIQRVSGKFHYPDDIERTVPALDIQSNQIGSNVFFEIRILLIIVNAKRFFSEFDPNATPLDWWQSLLQCNSDIFRCSSIVVNINSDTIFELFTQWTILLWSPIFDNLISLRCMYRYSTTLSIQNHTECNLLYKEYISLWYV